MSDDTAPQASSEPRDAGDGDASEAAQLEEDLAAVARVILGVDPPPGEEAEAPVSPAEERRRQQRRQQRMLDELSFLDD